MAARRGPRRPTPPGCLGRRAGQVGACRCRLATGHPRDLPPRAAPPGARHKLGFTDAAGHRFQVFITNQPDPDPAILEARHRPHAHVEDRIRAAKATGLRNLPLWGFAANDAWLSLVGIAQTLVCWAQALLLSGDCKLAEPKTLRFRLWHIAGRIVRHPRRVIVRIDRTWPWATDLVMAFARLRALPARG
jgi:Transposase DDE domain group 1